MQKRNASCWVELPYVQEIMALFTLMFFESIRSSEEKDANESVRSPRLLVNWFVDRVANPLITLINSMCVWS